MKVLLTGGSGFLGSQLCEELINYGHHVVILDNHSRGKVERLKAFENNITLIEGDIRCPDTVDKATQGCEMIWHLAYINGTRFFYEKPDIVLEVGIKGTINTLDSALKNNVSRYVLASTSETYNTPSKVPTDETERLMIPDVTNPRFSYGGGKIACELLTLHYGGFKGLDTVIFRPHNFIGPDMGNEHVIPELVKRIMEVSNNLKIKKIKLPIQGNGSETRSFCDVRDGAKGALIVGEKGKKKNIYHIGNEKEVSIKKLIEVIGNILDLDIEIIPGNLRKGGTPRRCPSIKKIREIGFVPQYDLEESVKRTVDWYVQFYKKESS